MRWLEEIRVRTQPQRENEVMELLLETAASVTPNRQLQAARVYSHHLVPAGFSLILVWDTASVPAQGSETAMLILEGVKAFGLLDYTVLVERGRSEEIKRSGGPDKPGGVR
jgi:hypothetical protein